MTRNECSDALLDFIHDRGRFAGASELEGMAVSQKPQLFVRYYVELSEADRAVMNERLVMALLGQEEETARFGGIAEILLLALVKHIDNFELKVFEPELLNELRHSRNRDAWMHESQENAGFRQNWRYALGIMQILRELRAPELRQIASEMMAAAQSAQFRQKLQEVLGTG